MGRLSKRIDTELCHTETMSDLGWFLRSGDKSLIDVISRQNETIGIELTFHKFCSKGKWRNVV